MTIDVPKSPIEYAELVKRSRAGIVIADMQFTKAALSPELPAERRELFIRTAGLVLKDFPEFAALGSEAAQNEVFGVYAAGDGYEGHNFLARNGGVTMMLRALDSHEGFKEGTLAESADLLQAGLDSIYQRTIASQVNFNKNEVRRIVRMYDQ